MLLGHPLMFCFIVFASEKWLLSSDVIDNKNEIKVIIIIINIIIVIIVVVIIIGVIVVFVFTVICFISIVIIIIVIVVVIMIIIIINHLRLNENTKTTCSRSVLGCGSRTTLAQWLRRPPGELKSWVRFPLAPWGFLWVVSYQ